ncbi:MAG: hypothetical protein WDA25_01765 [Paracoccaceae bacterium]
MFARLAGSVLRAICVVILIAMPSLLLPAVSPDTAQIVALICIFGAALTIMEYGAAYPGLIEFRDAPPFNRIRFVSLFITVLLLTLILRGLESPTLTTWFVTAIGALIGHVLDFPYSPVRLMVLMLPEGTSAGHIALVRTAAGISYLISLLSLAVFVVVLRGQRWPAEAGIFSVWVNLPMFNPRSGGDVVARLVRDGRFNIALGFLLPFVIPATVKLVSELFGGVTLANPHTLVWTIAAWAFLPVSLFMRGIALGKIARLIADQRESAHGIDAERFQPV